MKPHVYHYPACSTCKKALKFLDVHGVPHERVHIVDSPPSEQLLTDLVQRSGLQIRAFFNTSGQSYRDGGFKDRLPTLSPSEAIAALAADGKLIKRPLLIAEDGVLLGFREDEWRAALLN
ncbi:MAG: arsenate reductase family protein [Myxococcota bacterium]